LKGRDRIEGRAGEQVMTGDNLLVLSTMKMETVVKSPVSGKVTRVEVINGKKLEGDNLLVEIDD
jgi:biotin carboxyl carrier protein